MSNFIYLKSLTHHAISPSIRHGILNQQKNVKMSIPHQSPFEMHILPRQSLSWDTFQATAPRNSIALDGVVHGGPRYDPRTGHINFDHHDHVVREATMSTAMQVYFALKGGLMQALTINGNVDGHIYINDTDQDTSFAVWLLLNYKKFEGVHSIPHINRLLALTDRWDITGGSFPMNLDDQIVRQHSWVFEPYTALRKSGDLAHASAQVLQDNLDAVLGRLNLYLMGQAREKELDTRHEILYDDHRFKIVDEIGGNEARYTLFSRGMNAFISLTARRSDGRFVYSIGRRSQYIPFPVEQLYDDFNLAEGFTRETGWGGSNIVGGSSRQMGSGLTWEQVRDITLQRLQLM
jgi:hypothetical protein